MDILQEIIAHKKNEIEPRCAARDTLRAQALDAKSYPSFKEALLMQGPSIIAEVKKASPSAGIICEDFNPSEIAQSYEALGARVISVLTDEKYFKGHLDDLVAVRSAVSLPLIRKDFVVDELQLYEAKIAGASAFLLIAAVLSSDEIARYIAIGEELGLEALVEVHNAQELEIALAANPDIIGVNNRNLRTFTTDLATSHTLIASIRNAGVAVAVSESGIRSADEIASLSTAGYDAFLIGESLMRDRDKLQGFRL